MIRYIEKLNLQLVLVIFSLIVIFAGCAETSVRVGDERGKVEKGDSRTPTSVETRTAKPVKTMGAPKEVVVIDEKGAYEVVEVEKTLTPDPEKGRAASKPKVNQVKSQEILKTEPAGPVNKTSEKEAKEVPEGNGRIVFNFDNADLYEVIRTMAELLGINYIIDPNVRGKVTIHTAGKLGRQDLFPVFYQILEANGLTAVKEGNLYKIAPLKDAPRMPLSLRLGREGIDVSPAERVIVQIIPLKFIAAQEMTKLLAPFVSSQGTIISDPDSNTLVVVDRNINILKCLRLVDVFDVNLFEKVAHRFWFLENIEASEMAKILGEIFPMYATAHKADVKFITIEHLNILLAVSSDPQVFNKVGEFVRQLDVGSEDIEPRIYVYFVKNGTADQLSGLLNEVFGKGVTEKDKETKSVSISGNPFSVKAKQAAALLKKQKQLTPKPASKKGRSAVASEGSGTLVSEISITADEIRNALIIEAVPADYRIIEGILKRIDVLPRQVLIEATIAEISLSDKTELGIEWSYTKGTHPGSGLLAASMGEGGLYYTIGIANKIKADISALAIKGKVNILSSPHVLASDNIEAKIDVSDEIPLASSDYQYTTGTDPVIATNIEYRDTGVILSVTPHINEGGMVTMDINQEVSEYSGDYTVAGKKYPSFYKRQVSTTLTVKHGQTIVIGGLIREKESDTTQGMPCLVDIPVVRYLFGKDTVDLKKTELIILITPRVVINLEDVDEVTTEFKRKVGGVIKRFKKYSH